MREDRHVLPQTLDLGEADALTVLQLTDTHLSAVDGMPKSVRWLLGEIAADPPDLVALTGDIVYEDPDDADDRTFARAVFADLPCPLVAIPGNHDVGFYGEDGERDGRLGAFTETWGGDRFVVDGSGWRLVGANAYLLGDADHDDWLRTSITTDRAVAVFIHQPIDDYNVDGWEMPVAEREAFGAVVSDVPVRLVASGHRHRYNDRGRAVWAPSTTIPGLDGDPHGDPRLGAVEYTFRRDGTFTHRLIHTP
jgi:alkaline phosphatase D